MTAGSNISIVENTISATNTTYTGGTGITLSSTTFNLDTASASALGGVKVDGSTITIDGSGVISSSPGYTLPTASATTLGGIKVRTGLSIDSSTGVLSAGTVSSSTLEGQVLETLAGVCDGRSISVSSGTYTLENNNSSSTAKWVLWSCIWQSNWFVY